MSEIERITIDRSCLLVVEGDDEQRLFEPLLNKVTLNDVIQIINLKGKGNLAAKLGAIILAPKETTDIEISSIGIVMDADNDATKSFASVCKILQSLNLPVPTAPFQSTQESPKIKIAILPDGTSPGMLEDICLESVSKTPEMLCVSQYFECLRSQNLEPPANIAKAKVQAFLSAQKGVGIGVGIAAQRGFWNLDHPAFDLLKDFLGQLPV